MEARPRSAAYIVLIVVLSCANPIRARVTDEIIDVPDQQSGGSVGCELPPCPAGAVPEGEPDCFDDYQDHFNGGCRSTPSVFSVIPCDPAVTICGRYGGYVDVHDPFFFSRDTDWYDLTASQNPGGVTFGVSGSLYTLMGIFDAELGCPGAFVDFLQLDPCQPGVINVPPGHYWLFVATTTTGPSAGPCGSGYTMTVTGVNCPTALDRTNWGGVKAHYRD